ncbi:hypothetical protein CC86DRAFT_379579 [Ophiobolus disseminans]|uniref:Uncharacterized protein n=1 Tax=Ophiobolus disseminans TaxID=1469910 RepID=A0A6A7ABZ7_9PLEO|nr:hypothetical protein CC86DRAFT_379579 [Ophiobolus disseminans]
MIHTWKDVLFGRDRLQTSMNLSGDEASALEDYTKFVKITSKFYHFLVWVPVRLQVLNVLILVLLVILQAILSGLPNTRVWKSLLAMMIVPVACSFLCMIAISRYLFYGNREGSGATRFVGEEFTSGLYSRQATQPRDMALGMWAVLQKVSTSPLPRLDYQNTQAEVYWVFTIHLIQVTQLLSMLYLAAAKSFSDLPSWVPDWSARDTHGWTSSISHLLQDSEGFRGKPVNKSIGESPMSCPERQDDIYFEIDQTHTILAVRARHICQIDTLAVFHKTSKTLRDSELNFHIENLRMMTFCAS